MVNYFDLMGMTPNFAMDNTQLDTTFRQLQSHFHPDVTKPQTPTSQLPASALALANLSPEQASAVINTAYQTLKNPDSRATHLLELAGQADGLNDSIRDLDFLDKAMDLRISLEQADSEQLPRLTTDLQDWIHQVEQRFATAYQAQTWQTAQTATQQLKFLVKLKNDFAKKTDELANHNHNNDDDLYV